MAIASASTPNPSLNLNPSPTLSLTLRGLILALGLLALAGCTDSIEERTLRDFNEIGHGDLGDVKVKIDQGVVRDSSFASSQGSGFVQFRMNAPAGLLTFINEVATSRVVDVEVTNAMDASQVSVPSQPGPDKNTISFQVTVPADGETVVSVRPPAVQEEQGSFQFVWVGDVQGGNEKFQVLSRMINREPGVEFVLFAGDITQSGSQEEIDEFIEVADQLTMPWYSVLGNHENMSQDGSFAFQHTVGRINVAFDYRGARFILFDSSAATLHPMVYGFLDEALAGIDPILRVAACHVPPFDPDGLRDGGFSDRMEAARLLAILASGGVDLLFSGHLHSLNHGFQAGIETWASGEGGNSNQSRFDGSEAHYLVAHVDPIRSTVRVNAVISD